MTVVKRVWKHALLPAGAGIHLQPVISPLLAALLFCALAPVKGYLNKTHVKVMEAKEKKAYL